jgi:hypothetical protein
MSSNQYRRRAESVFAMQIRKETVPELEAFVNARVRPARLPAPGRGMEEGVMISTLYVTLRAPWGHFVVRQHTGEFTTMSPADFAKAYERFLPEPSEDPRP